jgi:Ca2+-binding RTX toxin-like protein
MTGGSSGGGWVIQGSIVNSVTSYGYQTDLEHLYGPYQGTVAEDLYETARGPRLACARVAVTNLGTAGADDYAGGGGRQGFQLRAGDDRASGGLKGDSACGGAGGDRLGGGGGGDVLRGGRGDDTLIGGPGRDLCDGGPGRDRAVGCERKRRIP